MPDSDMVRRFYLYALLRNLRFFEAFFVLFLVLEADLSYAWVGLILAYEKALLGLAEIPLALAADRLGRKSSLVLSFSLASVAFALFALALQTPSALVTIFIGQTLYGVAESLRTGAHKAIALDWMRINGQVARRTEILGRMRFFSKTSAGLAALIAGVVVWQSGTISQLFWWAIVPTLVGAGLLTTYPSALQGERRRARDRQAPAQGSLREAITRPALWALIVPSVLFESQVKVMAAYLQPALAEGSEAMGLSVIGGLGALVVGGYMGLSGLLAGSASLLSTTLVSRSRGPNGALRTCHALAALVATLAAIATLLEVVWLGLVFLITLAALQNARRPIFVTALDDVMVPEYRATLLSSESQARSWCYALVSVALGFAADAFGLSAVFASVAILLCLAFALSPRAEA